MKSKLFWTLWSIDALIGTIVLIFFFIGIVNGSVSSFNIGIWIIILAILAVILGGSFMLKKAGHLVFGMILLLVLAIPGLLYGLFLILIIVSNTSWN